MRCAYALSPTPDVIDPLAVDVFKQNYALDLAEAFVSEQLFLSGVAFVCTLFQHIRNGFGVQLFKLFDGITEIVVTAEYASEIAAETFDVPFVRDM